MATGDPVTLHDDASIAKYDVRATAFGWPRHDLLLTQDSDVAALCDLVLQQQKDDFIGVSSIQVDADLDPVHLFGVLTHMASTGIGATATLAAHWVHPSGDALDATLKMIGCHFVITMEGEQAKMTGEIRTALNQGPANNAPNWVTSHAYTAGQYVINGGVLYVCTASHTSGTDEDQPGVGAEWPDFWDLVV